MTVHGSILAWGVKANASKVDWLSFGYNALCRVQFGVMDKAPYESARVKFLLYGLFMPMPSNDQSMAHSLGDINDHMLRLQRLRMIL